MNGLAKEAKKEDHVQINIAGVQIYFIYHKVC